MTFVSGKGKKQIRQLDKFEIIYENSDFLIINKKAGLLVHPDGAKTQQTLSGELALIRPEIKQAGESELRPGIVHRLDRETAGLMLVVKNQQAFVYYKNLFLTRKIEKSYCCLIHGWLKNEKAKIDLPVGRSLKNTAVRTTSPYSKDRKEALTEYEILKRFKFEQTKNRIFYYSLLGVKLKTGRTHQIRVHMKSLGHPIVGDKVYKFKRQFVPFDFDRLFLISKQLKFEGRDKKSYNFEVKLPADYSNFLKKFEQV
ncbi:MAG: RluA family pseudouridine synthase [Candidatus Moranbacteria bacterium]|nr:RluA family pseudouridine synthase [Candidatus Moranbacteria bacterium]